MAGASTIAFDMIDLRPQAVNRNIKGQIIAAGQFRVGLPIYVQPGHFPIGCIRDHQNPNLVSSRVTIRQG